MSTKPNLYNIPIKKLKTNITTNELQVNNKKDTINDSLKLLTLNKEEKSPIATPVTLSDDKSDDKFVDKECIDGLPNEISSGAIIYNLRTHSVLLIQGKNKFFGFPKGHIEDGEDEVDTMKREVFEETGVDINKIAHVIIGDPIVQKFHLKRKYLYYDDCAPEVNRINIFYTVIINEETEPKLVKQESEILKLGWYPIFCALTTMKKTNSNQIAILEKALDNINSHIANKIFIKST